MIDNTQKGVPEKSGPSKCVATCPISALADPLDNTKGIRFEMKALPGLWFVRYPGDVIPADGTICCCGGSDWQQGAMFSDGVWRSLKGKPLARVPTHWTVLDAGNSR